LDVVFTRFACSGRRFIVASPEKRRDGEGGSGARTTVASGAKDKQSRSGPPLLADKIIVTEADGKVHNTSEVLAIYKKTKWDSADYYDVKVTVYCDTAIATGGFKGKGIDDQGKPVDDNERWTDTWVKMPSGKWQCVASHTSNIKM
jgi:hypothetical protein